VIAGTTARDEARWPPGLVECYSAEHTNLVRTAYLICLSRAHAEAAVPDALIRVAPRWDGLERARAYLYVAVANAARDVARRARRTTDLSAAPDGETASADDVGLESLRLRAALSHLSPRQRVVIVLRYFLDWNDDEIAARISARPATVRSLARRGLARLQQELKT